MSQKRPQNHSKPKMGQVRIIGGKYRGRKLAVRDQLGLRPTGDRIRETLFNWLQPHIVGARCADLFCGSGALGFEAASRGAEVVYLIDNEPQNTDLLRATSTAFNDTSVNIQTANATQWLQRLDGALDIVFIDPPFDSSLLQQTLDSLDGHSAIHGGSQIYIEAHRDAQFNLPRGWCWRKHSYSGEVQFGIAELSGNDAN